MAGDPSKERIALTAAGNAQARAEIVKRADVGRGWKGGFRKPNISSSMPCSNYRPKQSDLVLIGAAESTFASLGVEIDSEAQVLRTAAMVRRDWQRTILAPQVIPCLRQGFTKSLGSNAKLVSFGRIAFPHIMSRTRAFRAVASVQTAVNTVRLEIDFVAMGSGRNELTLTLVGPAAAQRAFHSTEVRLARVLAGRVKP
jgi:hypothetical protein